MIVSRPPASIEQTAICRRLLELSPDPDGLANRTRRFIEVANIFSDSIIAGPFKVYTLHNRDHARKLVHLAEHIIAPATIQAMTPLECLLVVYSAYLHDMGMSIAESEISKLLGSEEFAEHIKSLPAINLALQEKRSRLAAAPDHEKPALERDISELHCVALTHLLRPRHATVARYTELIGRLRSALTDVDPFQIRGVSFEEELVDICVSHNLDASALGETMGSVDCDDHAARRGGR